MPSRRLSARLALSLVSPVSPHRPTAPPVPGTKEQKEPRPERRWSGLKGALSRLIGWEKTRSSTSTSNRKAGWRWGSAGGKGGKRTLMGISFILLFWGAKLFLSADPSGHKLGEGRRSGGRELTASALRLPPRLPLPLGPSSSSLSAPALAFSLHPAVVRPFIRLVATPRHPLRRAPSKNAEIIGDADARVQILPC